MMIRYKQSYDGTWIYLPHVLTRINDRIQVNSDLMIEYLKKNNKEKAAELEIVIDTLKTLREDFDTNPPPY